MTKWASISSFSLPGEKTNSSRAPKRATILWRPQNFGPEPLELEALYSHPTRGPHFSFSYFPSPLVRTLPRAVDLAAPAPAAAATIPPRRRRRSSPAAGTLPAMDGSAPLGDGRPAWGTDSDGPSRTRPPSRLAGAPLPRGISGDGRPPRSTAPTLASKKRRSTFVAPTRLAGPFSGGVLPR